MDVHLAKDVYEKFSRALVLIVQARNELNARLKQSKSGCSQGLEVECLPSMHVGEKNTLRARNWSRKATYYTVPFTVYEIPAVHKVHIK